MNPLTAIIISILFLTLSLGSAALINTIQTHKRRRAQQLNKRRRKILELEELRLALEPIVDNLRLISIINDEIIRLAHLNLEQDPKGGYLQSSLATAEQISRDIAQNKRKGQLNRAMNSDADIARSKYYLTSTGNVLRAQIAQHRLDSKEGDALMREISWSYLMIDVITNIAQGHKWKNEGNELKCVGFYRKAQDLLNGSPIPDDRRLIFLKQVREILKGDRLAIEEDLMPEKHYNPKLKAVKTEEDDIVDMTQKRYW